MDLTVPPAHDRDHAAFEAVAKAFSHDRSVTREEKKGFGSGALKTGGKIFAMLSSKSEFVVKLPRARVDELVKNGKGERFQPGPGRVMKEWIALHVPPDQWLPFAREAHAFVKVAASGSRRRG